jgi:hypothetical protein
MTRRTATGWVGLMALLVASPAIAATASTSGTQSSCTNCTVLVDWNPTFDCNDPISSGYDLVSCLFASGPAGCRSNPIQEAPAPDPIGGSPGPIVLEEQPSGSEGGCLVPHETGNYWVTPLDSPPPFGLHILREDLTEIERLHFWENYPEITWMEIYVEQPNLIARIGEMTGTPAGGQIIVTLNGRIVPVDTAFTDTASDVNQALVVAIAGARFKVAYDRPYIKVIRDELFDVGLTRVAFESTDSGIVQSEVYLEPARVGPNIGSPGFGR